MSFDLRTDLEARQAASRSWFPPYLKTRPVLCEAVATPSSTEELAELVAWAQTEGKSLRAFGGGTGFAEPEPCELAVDTSRLTALTWDEEDLTVTVGAGWTLAALEEQLTGHGYTLGQHLGSANVATVGGCIATDAHGLFSGRYGSFRACVLDQKTLGGIVSSATLRLWPQPEARAWAVFDFGDVTDACDALRLIHRCDARPALARTHPGPPLLQGRVPEVRKERRAGGFAGGFRVLLAFEGDELVQTGHFQLAYAVCQQLGGAPTDPDEGERWLESRQRSELGSANAQPETFADFLRVKVPWSTLAETYQRLQNTLEGRVASYSLEVAHPSPHGAALELSFTIHGDERRYRELRGALLAC